MQSLHEVQSILVIAPRPGAGTATWMGRASHVDGARTQGSGPSLPRP